MPGPLIVLDKQPGVCPVGLGETWICLLDKIFLRVTGPEATSSCQDYHMCAGLKAGIYGTFHGVQAICDTKLTKERWGFLLVDTKTRSTRSIE